METGAHPMVNSSLKAFLGSGRFVARHVTFIIAATLAGWALWTIIYVLMLAIALVRGGGLGNAFTYPLGLLVTAAITAGMGGLIGLPACATSYWAGRRFQVSRLSSLTIVFGSGYLWILVWVYAIQFARGAMAPHPISLGITFLWTTGLPLLLYWWFTEGPWPLYEGLRTKWLAGQTENVAHEKDRDSL